MRFDPRPIAGRFWQLAGFEEPYPRDLDTALSLALPVVLVRLPRLHMRGAAEWLRQRGVSSVVGASDRQLKGCLIAHRGHGFIFLDGSLPPDEMRLSLAHEIAHFLQHYLLPREQAIAAMGPEIVAVLDGERAATPAEKLSGLVKGIRLGVFTDLLEREPDGAPSVAVVTIESQADLIAFELLAPQQLVLTRTIDGASRRQELVTTFGLPKWAAIAWAGWLEAKVPTARFMSGLRAVAKKS